MIRYGTLTAMRCPRGFRCYEHGEPERPRKQGEERRRSVDPNYPTARADRTTLRQAHLHDCEFRDWDGWRDGRPDSAVVYLIAKYLNRGQNEWRRSARQVLGKRGRRSRLRNPGHTDVRDRRRDSRRARPPNGHDPPRAGHDIHGRRLCLIFAGGGVARSDTEEALVKLAEATNIPVVTSIRHQTQGAAVPGSGGNAERHPGRRFHSLGCYPVRLLRPHSPTGQPPPLP